MSKVNPTFSKSGANDFLKPNFKISQLYVMLKLGYYQCDSFHRSGLFGAIIFIPLMGTSEQ